MIRGKLTYEFSWDTDAEYIDLDAEVTKAQSSAVLTHREEDREARTMTVVFEVEALVA